MTGQAVRIFSLVYGERYIQNYVKVALPSLLQSGNFPNLIKTYNASICLYTRPDSFHALRAALSSYARQMKHATIAPEQLLQRLTIRACEMNDGTAAKHQKDSKFYQQQYNRRFQVWCLLKEIEQCLEADAIMIVCNVDMFYGNGSIINLVTASQSKNCCIGSPHIRVDRDKFISALARETLPIDNSRLASMSLESLHESQRCGLVGPGNHTYLVGRNLLRLSDTVWAMRDFVPSVMAAKFRAVDRAYFSFHADFRQWDMTWSQKLIAEHRFAYVGSSDVALSVELTPAALHYLQKYRVYDDEFRQQIDPNDYLQNGLNSETLRNLAICLRTDRKVELGSL